MAAALASLFARRGSSPAPGPIPRPQRAPILESNIRIFLEALYERGGIDHPGLFRNAVDSVVVLEFVRPLLTGASLELQKDTNLDLLARSLLYYLVESRQPLLPVHIHKDLLFDFCNATNDSDRSMSLRKAVAALDPPNISILSHLCSFVALVVSRSASNQMSLPELTAVFAPVLFPPPPKPNPRLLANRTAITLHLFNFFSAILPDPTSPLSFFIVSCPGDSIASPRSSLGLGAMLTFNKLTIADAASSSSSSPLPPASTSSIPSSAPVLLVPPPSAGAGRPSPRRSTPRLTPVDENMQPNSEDDSSSSSAAALQRPTFGDYKTAELSVTGTTSPSQDPSLIAEDSILKMARTDPDAFWDTASRGHIPSDQVITTLVIGGLSSAEKNSLIQPLLRELILSECLASNGTATRRGCTHLYHSLCKWVGRRLESGGSSPETFLAELDVFLQCCYQPGDTCFVLSSFLAAAEDLKIAVPLDQLYDILEVHLPLLGESKQQSKLAFLPWLDAEKLLLGVTGAAHPEGRQTINKLKASYRALKRAAR